jgi:hypothetical protein
LLLLHPGCWRLRLALETVDLRVTSRCWCRRRAAVHIVLCLHARRPSPLSARGRGICARAVGVGALLALRRMHGRGLHSAGGRATHNMGRAGGREVRSMRAGAHGELAHAGRPRSALLQSDLSVDVDVVGRGPDDVLDVLVQRAKRRQCRVLVAVAEERRHVAHDFDDLGIGVSIECLC